MIPDPAAPQTEGPRPARAAAGSPTSEVSGPGTPLNPGPPLTQKADGTAAAPAGRRYDIDTLRAMACIALVSFHVVGVDATTGLELPADHPLRMCNDALAPLRMPIFAFLSGLVFQVPAPAGRVVGATLLSKARRLLLPMVCVSTLFWLIQKLAGWEIPPYEQILFWPYAHFWFLQASFGIMLGLSLLSWALRGRVDLAAGVLSILAVLWLQLGLLPSSSFFSLNGALALTPFFMCGVLVARGLLGIRAWAGHRGRPLGTALALAALACAVALHFLPPDLWGSAPEALAIFVIGLLGVIGLRLAAPASPALASLGRHSYAIYLFHVFFTAATTMGLQRILPGLSPWAIWPVSLGAGLFGPICVQGLILRIGGVVPMLALGLRPMPWFPALAGRAPRTGTAAPPLP